MSENWVNSQILGPFTTDTVDEGLATLTSTAWGPSEQGFYRARSCLLQVKGRFKAETLVIYPSVGHFLPIFGCEYIELPHKRFGAVDFHPVNRNLDPITTYLVHESDRTVEKSAHYDLDTHFSPKLWLERGSDPDIYARFRGKAGDYVSVYMDMLSDHLGTGETGPSDHASYNAYMAEHDPAHGILRAYFGPEFARDYIDTFLFPLQSGSGLVSV